MQQRRSQKPQKSKITYIDLVDSSDSEDEKPRHREQKQKKQKTENKLENLNEKERVKEKEAEQLEQKPLRRTKSIYGPQEEALLAVITSIPSQLETLRNESIKLYFFASSRDEAPGKGYKHETVPDEFADEFKDLAEIKDWRKKISDMYLCRFELNGLTWNSVEHYYQASKFVKKNPEFYRSFSVESETQLSKDAKLAKMAGAKNSSTRSSTITIDPDFLAKGRGKIELFRALYAKFTQNPELENILRLTRNATLIFVSPIDRSEIEMMILEHLRSIL